MTIAEEFQRRCDEFPQNAANLKEFEVAIFGEIYAASTEFHVVHDDKTIGAFVFIDGSAFTIVNCKGLHFAILERKELKAIRKARHFTEKDLQDLELAMGAERIGRGSNDASEPENRGTVGHTADQLEPGDL